METISCIFEAIIKYKQVNELKDNVEIDSGL
jgi:hypothetical protein